MKLVSAIGAAVILAITGIIAVNSFSLSETIPPQFERYPHIELLSGETATISWITPEPSAGEVQLSSGGSSSRIFKSPETRKQHSLCIDGLQPGSRYDYKVLVDGKIAAENLSLRAAPAADASSVNFFVLGDSGSAKRAQYKLAGQIAELAERGAVEFGLHTGDVSYGGSDTPDIDREYFRPYNRILSRIPIWLAIGNHDVRHNKTAFYLDSHRMPGNERWYSVDYGPVHIIFLDSTQIESKIQTEWLERDLSSMTPHPWCIAVLHYPPYSWPYADEDDLQDHISDLKVRETWCPLFEEYGVDIVFSGHSHNYQRTRLVKDYNQSGDGIYYIVTGGGGAKLHEVVEQKSEPGLMEAWMGNRHHFVLVNIDGSLCTIQGIDSRGEVFDRFAFAREIPRVKSITAVSLAGSIQGN